MSAIESRFIKWFSGMAATLLVFSIVGLIGMVKAMAAYEEASKAQSKRTDKIEIYNELQIKQVKEYHDRDFNILSRTQERFETNQRIIMNDVKELLKR